MISIKKLIIWINTAVIVTASTVVEAGPQLPQGGGSMFQIFNNFLQSAIDFIAGPFGLAAVIIGAVIAIVSWIVLPKEGILVNAFKVVISGIALANLGVFISSGS